MRVKHIEWEDDFNVDHFSKRVVPRDYAQSICTQNKLHAELKHLHDEYLAPEK